MKKASLAGFSHLENIFTKHAKTLAPNPWLSEEHLTFNQISIIVLKWDFMIRAALIKPLGLATPLKVS